MLRRQILTILSLIVFSSVSFSQKSLYIPFFSCEGCEEQTGVSSSYLLNDYIDGYGRFEVQMAQKRDSSVLIENFVLARESAELLSTNFFLVGRIVSIEDSYHISLQMYATASGLMVWKTSAQTDDLNDLPIILDKMASDLAEEKAWSQNGDVFRVYSGETKRPEKMKPNVGIGLSTGALMDLSSDDIDAIAPGYGFLLSFDVGRFIFETNLEYYSLNTQSTSNPFPNAPSGSYTTEDKYKFTNVYINVIYPLRATNSAPFVCLGSGISMMNLDSKTIRNATQGKPPVDINQTKTSNDSYFANGGIGYVLKRNSRARLYIYGRGYVFVNSASNVDYGVMFNVAVTIGR